MSKEKDELIRLNKFIANSGLCSRRKADELINKGLIFVNGEKVKEMGFKVKSEDKVTYKGKLINPEKSIYILVNKPKDHITTYKDTHGRKTVMDLIGDACEERVYPVGRLDRNTTGLLLITNDGELTKKLTHPQNHIKKLYHVSLNRPVKESDLQTLVDGLELEDGPALADKASYVNSNKGKKEVGVEVHSGRNRMIRRMFEKLGYKINSLDRVMYAGLTKKNLQKGKWRYLKKKEVDFLKML
ncbi:MAG: pseudouridine synthase [Flavobacteriales bacterium]